MRGWVRYLIFALAGYALYRLWPSGGYAWWILLASGVAMIWTTAMLKIAVARRASADLAAALHPTPGAEKPGDGPTRRVRYWLGVNLLASAVTLALSIWAIGSSV